jgi:hypothetical protein
LVVVSLLVVSLLVVSLLVDLLLLVVSEAEKRERQPGSEPGGLGGEVRRWCYVFLDPRCRVRRLVVMVVAMNAGAAAGMVAFGRYPLVGSARALPQRRSPEATRAERHERDTPGQATARRA